MNAITAVFPVDLTMLALSYEYRPLSFDKLEKHLIDRIKSYEPRYGDYLDRHLDETARDLRDFLCFKGYEEDAADKIGRAFRFHDLGKLAQPGLWVITEEKQKIGDEVKAQRREHTLLGPKVLDEAIDSLGLEFDSNDKAHIQMIKYLQVNHHRHLEADMDEVLRAAIIVDSENGKRKANDPSVIFEQMASPKHAGQFDLDLLDDYREFRARHRAEFARQALAMSPNS